MDKEKTIKSAIGLGAVGIAAYLAYTQLFGAAENTTIGGSGSFSGLGGAESLTDEGISGQSESGVSYNINLPQVDTSGISALMSGGSSILDSGDSGASGSSGGSVITGAGEIPIVTSKKSAVVSGDSTKAETSGSLSSSLAQVFGTEAQKTNERGDYYTTAAGGGAGAIKGKSLGEMALNLLTGKTASGASVSGSLPTGASTASNPAYDLSGVDVKAVLAADQAKKAQMSTAISQTKIGAYTPVSDPLQALKDSGIVKQTYNPSSTPSTTTTTTTKKAATSTATYKEGGQTKYKDASGKVHIVVNKKK